MNDSCTSCGQDFRMEPGFYFGAAYVSYGIMVGFNIALMVLFYLFVGNPFDYTLLLLTSVPIINVFITPLAYRYSRIIYLYMFVKYDAAYKKY